MKLTPENAKAFRELAACWREMKSPNDPDIQSAGDCADDLLCLVAQLEDTTNGK